MKRFKITQLILMMSLGIIMLSGPSQKLMAEVKNPELIQKVQNAIDAEYWDNHFNIEAYDGGRVDIEGEVRTLFDKFRIFDLISRVPGVTRITDNLLVNTETLPDNLIRDNIINELKLVNSIYEPDRIEVHVDNGEVILSGEVSYNREKLMAETVVSWQTGVKGVANEIKVLGGSTARSDDNLKIVLGEILKYRFPLDQKVNLSINNGEVTVSGTAYSMWDRDQIGKTFSGVPGVKKVDNQLQISPQL